MQYSDQGIAITACPVGMSPCAQNGTCPDIKVPILADPYSLEWWHSACNAQWLYQHRHVPVDMPTHHTNKDPQSSALKTDLYPNQVMMSCRSAYSKCDSKPGSPSLVSNGDSLSPDPTQDSGYPSSQASSPPSIYLRTDNGFEEASLSSITSRSLISSREISPWSEPQSSTYTLSKWNNPPLKPSYEKVFPPTSVKDAQDNAKARRKVAHNAVERRYRVNMNAKFIALGKAIPSLRAGKPNASIRSKGIKVNLNDSTVIQNKAEVLTKALAYIHELQEERSFLQNEVSDLRKQFLLPRGIW